MIHWFIFNSLVAVVCVLVLIEKNFGVQIGVLSPLAWVLLAITVFLLVKDFFMMRG